MYQNLSVVLASLCLAACGTPPNSAASAGQNETSCPTEANSITTCFAQNEGDCAAAREECEKQFDCNTSCGYGCINPKVICGGIAGEEDGLCVCNGTAGRIVAVNPPFGIFLGRW